MCNVLNCVPNETRRVPWGTPETFIEFTSTIDFNNQTGPSLNDFPTSLTLHPTILDVPITLLALGITSATSSTSLVDLHIQVNYLASKLQECSRVRISGGEEKVLQKRRKTR